ncbi:MAG: hypothetical protein KA760_13835 [Steroidobacteraceae bacterium]|nr:hypothetical protein [Steroidobacteraceae bacterium]
MNRRYMDLYDEQLMVSRVWRLGCACLAVALAIACLQWGRALARAVRAEGSVERSMDLTGAFAHAERNHGHQH